MADPGEETPRSRGPQHAAPKPPHRTRRRVLWVLGIVTLVVVLLVAGVGVYLWHLNSQIHRVTVKHLKVTPTTGADANTENILMVGSTSRCALKQQSISFGLCSEGVDGVNSDVIMILHLDPATHAVSILSIPRDLFVPNARTTGPDKIDAALFQGPSQLVNAIEEDFGIPIQHYVELNFDSFAGVVDALGGVSMYFPEPVYDQETGLNIQTPGCVHLDGFQALALVRARHVQYKGPGVTSSDPAYWPQDPESDLSRIRRDHEFLRVLGTAVAAKGLGDPLTDRSILAAVAPQLQVDSSFSLSDMLNLVLTYHSVNPDAAPQLTLPVSVDDSLNYYFQGYNYGNVELTAEPLDHQVVDQFLGVSATTNTMTGHALPAPARVTVSILNGSGLYDQGAQTASALEQLGFQVPSVATTNDAGTAAESEVIYLPGNAQSEAAAQAVADDLSGPVVLTPGFTANGTLATLVIGSDLQVSGPAPAAPATTTTTAGHTTTTKGHATTTTTTAGTTTTAPTTGTSTTTTTVPTAPNFSAPTASVEALAPFDPRSCTPSGGEGT